MFLKEPRYKGKDNKKFKVPISIFFVLFAIIVFFLGQVLEKNPEFLEKYYSLSINKWTIEGLSQLTGVLPFSLAEIIYVSHWIFLPLIIMILIWKVFRGGFFKFFGKIIIYICTAYILFMFLWGFNYSRISVSEMIGFDVSMYSKTELYNLNIDLVQKANHLRTFIEEDKDNVMTVSCGYKDIFSRADKGYDVAGKDIKALSGRYGRPKSIALSKPMLHTRITGMYFPFTAEANVNTATTKLLLPATTLHEMAHQRGIAPEDEANFVAYLISINHPDYDFQYSGTVLALIHSMNALSKDDYALAQEVQELYSDGLRRDLKKDREFWKQYEGKTSEIAERVNDTYLKSNRQEDGVKSYGKMVDLLLAYNKANN